MNGEEFRQMIIRKFYCSMLLYYLTLIVASRVRNKEDVVVSKAKLIRKHLLLSEDVKSRAPEVQIPN